jgi:uncharacterized SAM-binding protein YcdF (DUF218 family)
LEISLIDANGAKTMQAVSATQFKVIIRILCDVRPSKQADAVYLYAQSSDNEDSVIFPARKLLGDGLARRILLMNNDANPGYPGYQFWKGKLVELGIEENRILGVDLATDDHNTLTEAEAVVRFAKQNNYKSMIVLAAPFHQIRAFMTTVRVVLAEYPELKLYSIPGDALSWDEKATHSQGALSAKRSELIEAEFERIQKYLRKGDLISFDRVMGYFEKRDQSDKYE